MNDSCHISLVTSRDPCPHVILLMTESQLNTNMIFNSESTKIFLGSIAVIVGSMMSIMAVGTAFIGLSPTTANEALIVDLSVSIGLYALFALAATARKPMWFVTMAFLISFVSGLGCALAARFVNPAHL